MKESIISIILHIVAVSVALGVAYVLIQVLNVDGTVQTAVIGIIVLLLEKLSRELGTDWVNRY